MRSIELTIFAAGLALLAAVPASAQKPAPQAPAPPPAQTPAQAPPKPYKPIAVTAPAPMNDAGLDALRKQLGEIAAKKNKGALAGVVVAKGFFWDRADNKPADPKKSGADNLSAALGLPDDAAWDGLASFASDPTAEPSDDHKGAVCSPAAPQFDDAAAEALAKSTGTDPAEWGYVSQAGAEIHAKADAKSPVVEKVDMILIRVYDDPNAQNQSGDFTRVVGPSGKVGFISADVVRGLSGDQLCYVKEGAAWKIGGYVGGGEAN